MASPELQAIAASLAAVERAERQFRRADDALAAVMSEQQRVGFADGAQSDRLRDLRHDLDDSLVFLTIAARRAFRAATLAPLTGVELPWDYLTRALKDERNVDDHWDGELKAPLEVTSIKVGVGWTSDVDGRNPQLRVWRGVDLRALRERLHQLRGELLLRRTELGGPS